jgi:hypothetical protein
VFQSLQRFVFNYTWELSFGQPRQQEREAAVDTSWYGGMLSN